MPTKAKPASTQPMTAADFADVPVLNAKAGETLTISVDVDNPSDPYLVIFRKTTVMIGQVDREETVENLPAGTHRLSWSFLHREKGWKHRITAAAGREAPVLLDERSEAKKDPPYTIGVALVVVQP